MDTVQFADGSSLIMGGSRGGGGEDRRSRPGSRPPLENHKNIVFFSNTGPDPIENLKAIHVPSQHYMTGHHRSASETPFK